MTLTLKNITIQQIWKIVAALNLSEENSEMMINAIEAEEEQLELPL